MKFYQKEDGSCDIVFSDNEIKIINKHKKIILTAEAFRHFGNVLVTMVAKFQLLFDDKIANLETKDDAKIEGQSPDDTNRK
jgi:hypothetical protein|tara:strand:+ start:195 stop:437 length:243 start_codon:yes stop_codon:yes gene_type:complete